MTHTTPTEHLQLLHGNLRDSCTIEQQDQIFAVIGAFAAIGVLTVEEVRLWCVAIHSCPGHDDEGGRVWCAYCGNLPREEGEA